MESQVIKLEKGSAWAQYEVTKGKDLVAVTSSAGEFEGLPLFEARERIGALMLDGWRVVS